MASDEPPVPAQKCFGPHDEDRPPSASQELRSRSKEDPVGVGQLRSGHLSTQDRQLVPQHYDLEVLRTPAPEFEAQEIEYSSD
jgi:hypothetical protein